MLFTGKQHCLHFFHGTYIPAMNICLMQYLKFSGVKVLAVQLLNKIKWKKKMKNLIKTCFSVFPTCYVKIFLVNLLFFSIFFRHLCQ